MAEEMGADEVARKQFSTAFRGFDQYEVRAFLAQVASTIATLREREKAFREKVAGLEAASPAPHRADEVDLEQALGAEMTKVLHAAREAASEIRVHAEESVARLLREATDEAASLRADAESILAKRTEEAEAQAAALIAAAEERGREMVGEAQSVRERMLKDLSRKRKVAAVQLEQLLAARQRLLDAYDVVRQNLDSVTDELNGAEEQAKLAADVAGFKRRAEEPADDVELSTPVSDAGPSHEPESTPEPEPSSPTVVVIEDADAAAGDPTGGSGAPGDDRRSSSLRLLRRKPEPVESIEDGGSEGEVHEGVRLLRPEATPAPRPVSLVRDEPESAGEELGEPELPDAAVDDDLDEPDLPEDEVLDGEVLDGEGFGDDAPAAPVEDLFARLRADRAAALEHAQTVLTEPEPEAAVEPESESEPEPEVAVDEPGADVGVPPESPEAAGDAVFEARDAALEPLERALTRALKRALADEQNEVLDTLRRAKRTPSLEELMPSAERHAERFAAVSGEHLRAGVEVGAASHDGAAPDVDELAHQFGADITDDVRARVGRALDSTGNDDEALVEAISATYREWKTSRSEPFARHHLAAAYALGAFSALEDGSLRWIVDVAEGGCPDCDDNALAGPTPKGERYPTGQAHPPAHMGCRCLVVPLAK
jgi:DivIVA domain-containing protein